jgi:methionyl-tRNA formyltransferase
MRIVFCGTPSFAVPALRHLLAQGDIQVESVVTQPDRPRGRGQEIAASRVKEVARTAGIPIFQPAAIKTAETADFFRKISPDAVVIIAYGQIIPATLLEIPRLGWINLHASLLPKYRGAAPIQWAIAKGETRTGLTTMRIDAGLDTGDILLQAEIEIGADETAPELAQRMAEAGAPLVAETLRKSERGEVTRKPQEHARASFAPVLKREDGRVDWALPAQQIYNRIRGFAPWPGAFTTFRGQTCHVWGRPRALARVADAPGAIIGSNDSLFVACGDETWLELESVQVEGRRRVSARDFAHGARLGPQEKFN